MRIFITGAGGLVGTHLTAALNAAGHDCVTPSSRECDLRSPSALDPWRDQAFDLIFHLAAWTQAGTFCDRHRGEQWLINERINSSVLEFWHYHQPQAKLVALGTSASYPPESTKTEPEYLTGIPADAYLAYAYGKRSLLVGMESIARQFDRKYLYLVPSMLHGAGYRLGGRQLHFIYDISLKIINGHKHGTPVRLWGDGHQRRELVAVKDFVQWMITLAGQRDNEVINLGAGSDHSIRELAGKICHLVGYEPDRLEYDTSISAGVSSRLLNVNRLNTLLPDRPVTPLDAALRETVNWVAAEAHKLDKPQPSL